MTVNHSDIERSCRVCGGSLTLTRGEHVCMQCGAVDSPVLVSTFSAIDRTSPGKKPSIVDNLGSYVDYNNHLSFDNYHIKYRRWKRLNLRSKMDYCEIDLRSLLILNRVCALLQVSSSIKDRAGHLYKVAVSAERSNTIEKIPNHVVLVALCLLVAIRESASNAPVRFSEVVKVFQELGHRVSGKAIGKLLRNLPPELGLSLKLRRSEDYLQRIISTILEQEEIQTQLQLLDLDSHEYGQQLLHLTNRILQKLVSRGGTNPYIFAVSAVYAADRIIGNQLGLQFYGHCRQILRQGFLAKISGICEYSIRSHLRDYHRAILKELEEDLDRDE